MITATRAAMIVIGAVIAAPVAQTIDTRLFPVISDFEVTDIWSDAKGNIWFFAQADKVRGCQTLAHMARAGSPYDETFLDPLAVHTFESYRTRPDEVVTRDTGQQRFGPLRITAPEVEPTHVEYRVMHKCHGLWLHISTLAEFDYPADTPFRPGEQPDHE